MALITCKDTAFAYDGKTAVSQLNFSVEEGQYLAIVGENGSGKSTLLKGLLKLIAPSSGQLLFDKALKPQQIGYLPQQTVVQRDFPASVMEVVLSGRQNNLRLRPFYNAEDRRIALANMEKLAISELKSHSYRELSIGQQRRVLLARALCSVQRLLFLDEPVAGLDPIATADLYQVIDNLNHQQGITVVMVSHDIAGITERVSHVLHLKNQQLFFGTMADYLKSEISHSFRGCVHV